jgi:glycine hydroxymethyltransferase
MIVCGASGYPRDFDYPRFRAICDKVGALLLSDIAHTSGLIASRLLASPFEHSDVVTTTTHKSLRGPRAALIFYRKKYEEAINFAVFPQLQGGPHNTNIAGIAVQLKEVNTDEFRTYSKQVVANAKALTEALAKRGEKFITGGTDNHLLMWDIRPHDLTGSKAEKVFDKMHITTNKNALVGDKS